MSDVMLQGVLYMPPELWDDGVIDRQQRYRRYLQASRRIENNGREIGRLRAALERIASMEAFETSRAIDQIHDAELLARIEYAQASLMVSNAELSCD